MKKQSQILKWKRALWVFVSTFALFLTCIVSNERAVPAHSGDMPSISAETSDTLPLKPGGAERNAEPVDLDGETAPVVWAKFVLPQTILNCPVMRGARSGFSSGVERPPKPIPDNL